MEGGREGEGERRGSEEGKLNEVHISWCVYVKVQLKFKNCPKTREIHLVFTGALPTWQRKAKHACL